MVACRLVVATEACGLSFPTRTPVMYAAHGTWLSAPVFEWPFRTRLVDLHLHLYPSPNLSLTPKRAKKSNCKFRHFLPIIQPRGILKQGREQFGTAPRQSCSATLLSGWHSPSPRSPYSAAGSVLPAFPALFPGPPVPWAVPASRSLGGFLTVPPAWRQRSVRDFDYLHLGGHSLLGLYLSLTTAITVSHSSWNSL